MFLDIERKLFVVLWNTEFYMGLVVWGQQNIEKTVEFPFADVANVANFHGGIQIPRIWLPKCVSKGRKLHCEVVAENIIVSHHTNGGRGAKSCRLYFEMPM